MAPAHQPRVLGAERGQRVHRNAGEAPRQGEGALEVIDWYFRFRGRTIHKYCHFFLFESESGEPVPQTDEGITACVWKPLDEALGTISYANAREVLQRAAARVEEVTRAADGA